MGRKRNSLTFLFMLVVCCIDYILSFLHVIINEDQSAKVFVVATTFFAKKSAIVVIILFVHYISQILTLNYNVS